MHGTGNDFIMIDNFSGKIKLSSQRIKQLCDRHFGIGADGVILIEKAKLKADFFMNYYNADGSIGEMCGNGSRCTAHFAKEFLNFNERELDVAYNTINSLTSSINAPESCPREKFTKNILDLETRAGIKKIDILKNNLFRVNMGKALFGPNSDFPDKPEIFNKYKFYFVSMGNPHAIVIVKNEIEFDDVINNLAPKMENNLKFFPSRINISVAIKKSQNHFFAKTHERGSGQTLACGTGMSAVFAVLEKEKYVSDENKIQINVPGGSLFFEFNENKEILMTGPSEIVFFGEIK